MRLKEIENTIKMTNPSDSELELERTGNDAFRRINNINNFKEFINILERVLIYDDEIKTLRESELYQTTQNSLTVKRDYAFKIFKIAKYLTDSTQALAQVFTKLLPSSNEKSISVKLPEPSDYEKLVKTMSTLQKSISQVIVHDDIKGSIKVNNWEFGSFWIDLFLGTQAAVTVVSSIAWSAAVISKKFNENKILEMTVKTLKIKNESLVDILDRQKDLTRELIDNETNLVLDKHYTDKDPEHFERIKSTIKTFARLIQDGAEIHPSLTAPEEVKNLFPNYKKLDSIASKTKLLEDKSEEKESDQ